MKALLALVAKDFRIFWKDKIAVVVSFLVPMALITIFGLVFGGSNSGPSGIRLLVVDEARNETSAELIRILKAEDTFRVSTKKRLDDETLVPLERAYASSLLETNAGSYRYVLIFPENLLSEDFGLNLELLYNPQNSIENNIVQGILQKTLFTEAFPLLLNSTEYGFTEEARGAFNTDMADIISEHFGADPEAVLAQMESGGLWGGGSGGTNDSGDAETGADDSPGSSTDGLIEGVFNFEKTQVFGKNKNPAAQSVGGWAVMFMLFAMTGAASSLFEERDRGLFQRILAGPAGRSHILWSKFIFCSCLGLSQMIILLVFGEIVFDVITSPAQILPLLVISACAAAASTAFGMLLASVSKTPAQANGLGTFFILAMSAFGGAMFPLFMIPEFIRTNISPLTIVYWAMDGLLAVLWRDAGLVAILPQSAVLLVIAAGVLAIALWRFQRGDLFR